MPNQVLRLEEQRKIFSYRSRMNPIKNNFNKMNYLEKCDCGIKLTNEHIYTCVFLNEGRKLNVSYNKLFNGTLSEQKQSEYFKCKYDQNLRPRGTFQTIITNVINSLG